MNKVDGEILPVDRDRATVNNRVPDDIRRLYDGFGEELSDKDYFVIHPVKFDPKHRSVQTRARQSDQRHVYSSLIKGKSERHIGKRDERSFSLHESQLERG